MADKRPEKVYVITFEVPYEGGSVVTVFYDEDKAKAYIDQHSKNRYGAYYDYDEYLVEDATNG